MNHDVDDRRDFPSETQQYSDNSKAGARAPQGHIFSRIRNFNNLALASLGSLFSASTSNKPHETASQDLEYGGILNNNLDIWNYACPQVDEDQTGPCVQNENQLHAQNYYDVPQTKMGSTDTLTPQFSGSNTLQVPTRFPEDNCIINTLAHSRRPYCYKDHIQDSRPHSSFIVGTPAYSMDQYTSSSVPRTTAMNSDLDTPPLTPDTANDHTLPSPTLTFSLEDSMTPYAHDYKDTGDSDALLSPAYVQEIKQGKRPERPADCTAPPESSSLVSNTEIQEQPPRIVDNIDIDEWYGLEYTLELSSRERHPSDTQSYSAGEHSKSRESWAAIHKGRINPFFEDEDYYQWKNWHRYLDRQDERRKHRKGFAFKARAKELAWFYADEMRTRDVMYWQKEVYGVIGRDVKDRLSIIAERYPDPFKPPKKHNLGWYLKRSRSVGCMREFQELSCPTYKLKTKHVRFREEHFRDFAPVPYF